MTATTATPQVMRDRLLQAIDGQSNICNMVVVMEVITFLEKYPITKEALEETRLGRLINDVRKKAKNEELAKRAKKLLRNWQKLIEPGKSEVLSKGPAVALWSSNGCISVPAVTTPSGKTGQELKNINDFNNCSASKVEKLSKKRKKDQKEVQLLPAKVSKTTLIDKVQNSKQLLTNGSVSCSEMFTDMRARQPLDKEVSEPLDNNRPSKIPVNTVKPHLSAPGISKPSSTSLLKASIQQQQARQEQPASGGQYQPRNQHGSLRCPQASKQDASVKQTASQTQRLSVDTSVSEPSSQPLNVFGQGPRSTCLDSLSRAPYASVHHSYTSSFSNGVTLEDDNAGANTWQRKRQKYKLEDCVVNSDRQTEEDSTKPVRLKDRRLTFDPVTGQIKPSLKESSQCEEVQLSHTEPESQQSEPSKKTHNLPVLPSPFHQTDWKELSRSGIIQSYLTQQSNVLTSLGAHTPGAHFFMTEFLKKEEYKGKIAKKTHTLALELPARDLPGVNREVRDEELKRLHTQHWSGVNGCYDTKGKWFDWTECISVHPHADESMLNILPYVCLD
ncbi:mediator of RNA polymerase II transcription subunit 26 isoform X2 [Halichoeres trimaculatus]|uniref:mediator of RNA polymerase II transcription subunit 26 isoform X2 n=1 Tax=Halichoeres trimaculatus TaxID=147232 RepID=UPI003D9EE0A3